MTLDMSSMIFAPESVRSLDEYRLMATDELWTQLAREQDRQAGAYEDGDDANYYAATKNADSICMALRDRGQLPAAIRRVA